MIERAYISDGGSGQLHYARAGSGPTIICLHQTPRSWDEFREVMLLLQRDFQIVAMDLPGMGGSSSANEGATIEAYASAVIKLAQSLKCSPIILCGHHTGGVVAIEAAAQAPDLFRALILSSTPWIDEIEREARRGKAPIDTISRNRDGEHVIDLWRQRSNYYPADVSFMDRFLLDALACNDPAEGHQAVGAYAMERSAPAISCPVLIVEHSQDPFASKHTKKLLEAFPDASLERISNGQIPLEASATDFARIVHPWAQEQFQTTANQEGVS